jgi:hypothetical protein
MNVRSLKLIREVMINSSKLTSVEIAQDSIYLEFKDVELGVPKESEDFPLTVRFAVDSFITAFYNNIWDSTSNQSEAANYTNSGYINDHKRRNN